MKRHNSSTSETEVRTSENSFEKPIHLIADCTVFQSGELYLFHDKDPDCPAESSLWGIYDRTEAGRLYLESSCCLHPHGFRKWHVLPGFYRYCRQATRSELRDYICNLIFEENREFALL